MNKLGLSITLNLLLLLSCTIEDKSIELIPSFSEYEKDPSSDYLEIIAYGDFGIATSMAYSTANSIKNYALATTIEFIISLGDNFYTSGVSSIYDVKWDRNFEDIFDKEVLTMPFYSILGNHDYRGSIDAQIDYRSPNNNRWRMPNRYYSIIQKLNDDTEVGFLFIDTESLLNGDEPQLAWISSAVETSEADWLVVSGHRPIYSNGEHGSNTVLISQLNNILRNRVDIYLSGHDHNIQILAPIEGVYYIISGSSAKSSETGIASNTILATTRYGFVTLLFSKEVLVCNIMESGGRLLYSQVLKVR